MLLNELLQKLISFYSCKKDLESVTLQFLFSLVNTVLQKKVSIFDILFYMLSMFNSMMLMAKTLHCRANILEILFYFNLFSKNDDSAFSG
jgi:hypothetical protein